MREENQSAYLAYQTFEQFKRKDEMNIKEYIYEFEKLYAKVKKHDMKLPDGVLTIF